MSELEAIARTAGVQNPTMTFSGLRQVVVKYAAFMCGVGVVLPLLKAVPGVGSIPGLSVAPLLPVAVIGIAYWLFSGRYRESIAMWLILGVMTIWLLGSSQPALGIGLAFLVATMIAISALVVDGEDWILASRYFIMGSILGSLVLFYCFLSPPHPYVIRVGNRVGWLRNTQSEEILDPNITGFHAGFALLVILALLTSRPWDQIAIGDRLIAIAGGLLAIIVVIGTKSIGAYASILGSIVIVIMFGKFMTKSRNWAIVGSITLLGIALIGITNPTALDRLSFDRISSVSGRLPIWTAAADFVTSDVKRFLFGSGTGGGGVALGQYDPTIVTHLSAGVPPEISAAGEDITIGIHSTYVSWLLEHGMVGVTIAAVALMFAVLRARRIDTGRQLSMGLGFIAFFLLISFTQSAYGMSVIVSAGCGGMALAFLYHSRELSRGS